MNRKQKRQKLINYFLKINQAQQQVQLIQNDLISHIRFNPVIIFKRISSNRNYLKLSQLIEYIQTVTGTSDREIIKKYVAKHCLGHRIQLSQFTATILPYTPNVLRETAQKIDKQMETKHLDNIIVELYHQLLKVQIRNIYEICIYKRQLKMGWDDTKRMILKDLYENSRKIDLQPQQSNCNIVNIRKWIELWVEIDQYKILNIMRWFGGYQQKNFKNHYQNGLIDIKCTCQNHTSRNIYSIESDSKQNQCSIAPSKNKKIKKVKSESNILKDAHYYLKLFLKYVETIIKSQRRLEILRENLRPHKKQVELILHQITSKKSNFTKINKLIGQIEKILSLKFDMTQKLYAQLQKSKVDNNFIFLLFAVPSSKKAKVAAKLSKQQIVVEVYEVLYTFCLSKATLKGIAREMKYGSLAIFKELNENNLKYLDATDMKLILKECSIKCREQDITILMNHFGNGQIITFQMFHEVLQIQSQT